MGSLGYPPVYAPHAPANRVAQHLRPVGVLWLVYGGFRLVRGVIAILILHSLTVLSFGDGGWPLGTEFHAGLPVWMHVLVPMIAAITVLGTLLSFVTGYALLTRRSWGRTLAIIAAALSLIKIPLGTGIGIYTLWVLAPAASSLEYEATHQR
jgi:hypothetical protein